MSLPISRKRWRTIRIRCRHAIFGLIVLILICRTTIPNYSYHHRLKTSNESDVLQQRSKKVVLIVSYPRSGSSLLGQLFSHHPDVFFLFEPFRVAERGLYKFNETFMTANHIYEKWLTLFINCSLQHIVYVDGRDPNWARAREGFDIYFISLARSIKSVWIELFKRRDAVPLTKIEQHCKTLPFLAIKSIRVQLNKIVEFLADNQAIKVVHLIRDPRAVDYSRKVNRDRTISRGPTKVCRPMVNNLKWGRNLSETILKDRYMLLSYEQLIEKPVATVRQLLKFAELPEPEFFVAKFVSWVRGNQSVVGGHNPTHARDGRLNLINWRNDNSSNLATSKFRRNSNCSFILNEIAGLLNRKVT